MSDISENWCTIESDPGVFTSLLDAFGVKNVEVSEIWSLDDDNISKIVLEFGRVYGLIFLFKWNDESMNKCDNTKRKSTISNNESPEGLFYAKQIAHNACATQAILSVLLNSQNNLAENSGLVLGPLLSSFKNVTSSFTPHLKGEAIAANQEIREAHNRFCRNKPFFFRSKKRSNALSDEDIFHFIAYVPHIDGRVYELDGLQSGPIVVGTYSENRESVPNMKDMNWLVVARSAILKRIGMYSKTEIKFNLLAIVKDKRCEIQVRLDEITNSELNCTDKCEMVSLLKAKLMEENDKRVYWRRENERRNHNYLPFIIELIKVLAESGKLPELIQDVNDYLVEQRRLDK